MSLEPADLVFRARALAQAHPLTSLASRYLNHAVAQERVNQPIAEIGIWAGGSLIDGYCLRRVEEEYGVAPMEPPPERDEERDAAEQLEELDRATTEVAADIRRGDVARYELAHEELTIAALDRLIAGAVERRLDHWRDGIDEQAWTELEEYLTWWVVKGYALRVAEVRLAAATPPGAAG